jgi:hypothetical protein
MAALGLAVFQRRGSVAKDVAAQEKETAGSAAAAAPGNRQRLITGFRAVFSLRLIFSSISFCLHFERVGYPGREN